LTKGAGISNRGFRMLTVIDVPRQIDELYHASKLSAETIVRNIAAVFPSRAIDARTELCTAVPASMVVVRNGIFKYYIQEKLVRFYSTGDIIAIPDTALEGISIYSEFGAEVCVAPKNDFLQLLLKDVRLMTEWYEYQRNADFIMHALCSLFIKEEFEPHSEIRRYAAGEVIIREGESPDYLFEMLEGSARVTVGETEIGTVKAEEVFGEVSFLTGAARGATVTATSQCLVQAIKRPDLEKFSRHRPGLIYKLSQTLALRLNEVNKRLVHITSMT